MAAKIRGRAVRWSTGGIAFTAGIVSTSNPALAQRWNLKLTATKTKIKDENGSTATVVYSDPERQFSLDVIPIATAASNTIAAAQGVVDAYGLFPGTVITAADANGTIIDSATNAWDGKYLLDDAELVAELEAGVLVRLTMSNSPDNDLSIVPT